MESDARNTHERWMHRCLERAAKGAGAVSPNPMVGCVILSDEGRMIGEGWHEKYGGAHAEVNAIADVEQGGGASLLPRATLYVNLEPCTHFGKTPPCADLILRKRIPRVVVGMTDPFPDVNGSGVRKLKEAGVEVVTGVLEKECRRLNEAFVHHHATGRPLVTVKTAQTLDGQIATATGNSRWISGDEARELVHRWRTELDAVMVGTGTARHDDPSLTVRHVHGRQPLRVTFDRMGRLPPGLRLLTDEWASHTLIFTAEGVEPAYAPSFLKRGGKIRCLPAEGDTLDVSRALEILGTDRLRGGLPVQSVLVEGGPALVTSLIRHNLVDRYFAFIAPKVSGLGIGSVGSLPIERISDAVAFTQWEWQEIGGDLLFRGFMREA